MSESRIILSSQFDMSGAGYGTTFLPEQKCKLGNIQSQLQGRGLSCRLDYGYDRNRAMATLALLNATGLLVSSVKLVESWMDNDRAYPHYLYNYDVYDDQAGQWMKQIAFSQRLSERCLPKHLSEAMLETLAERARQNNLYPKVTALRFGKSAPL